MNNVTLKAVITEGGTTLYDQSSAAHLLCLVIVYM